MEDKVELMARDIAQDMVQQEKVLHAEAFDPATILIIIQLIIFLFNLFKKKNPTPSGIQRIAKKSNLIQRAIIKYRLNKYMKENSDHYKTYEKYKDKALKVTLNEIANSQLDTLRAVMNEVPIVPPQYLG